MFDAGRNVRPVDARSKRESRDTLEIHKKNRIIATRRPGRTYGEMPVSLIEVRAALANSHDIGHQGRYACGP